jgi:hypothetical protein
MITPIEKQKFENDALVAYEKFNGDFEKVAEFLNDKYKDKKEEITARHVEIFIEKMGAKINQPLLMVVKEDANLINRGRAAQINLLEKTNEILKKAEDHISEIEKHYEENARVIKVKCPDKNCGTEFNVMIPKLNDVQYHKSKDQAIRTVVDQIKHLRSTQIQFMELAKNQLLREAIIDVIKCVDPEIADEIFRKIDQKQREFGML